MSGLRHNIRTLATLLALILVPVVLGSCVYYNTFHNARKAFNSAESARKDSGGRGRGNISEYRRAIEKSLKVVEKHPNSKYYDDALYVLTVSYFWTDEYAKSERRARELLANYPNSKYTRDATLYMAKAKLELTDREDAMVIFQDIFNGKYDKEFKAEAALALGTFYYDNAEYENADPYLLALRDSLGSEIDARMAQLYLANGLFERYRFAEALSAYLQLLGMDPNTNDRYTALYQAAECSYRLQRIHVGQDYLKTLMDDDLYYDSTAVLRLKVAEGYELKEELDAAEDLYRELTDEDINRNVRAQAYWRLGLMYQYDYDNLTKAKELYDSTTSMSRSSDIGKQALELSSDIGKIDTYQRTLKIDSTTTQSAIDEAGYTQYLLAELYWSQLDKPDTAMLEMQYVVDSFPTAYDAPKAMIALSQMYRVYLGDSAAADSVLRDMLNHYPNSDYVPEALEVLNLIGTAADTGYAQVYFDKAEDFLVDDNMPDSAKYYYQYVVDHFPESQYFLQAKFATIWVDEQYFSPGDSSIVFAYNEFVDSFPDTYWADQAQKRTNYRPKPKPGDTPEEGEEGYEGEGEEGQDEYAQGDDEYSDRRSSGGGDEEESDYVDPLEAAYIGPDGTKLQLLNLDPIRIVEEFEYPTEAYRDRWEGDIYFQIELDFSGEVSDYLMVIKSPNDEINRRAEETMRTMTFDVTRIPSELQGQWLVYKFRVYLPDHLR
ncbi:MAG TPA: hypothetical protein PLF13_04535 [candidate division Zixibacteria bacterium]|nr:hypothetical protein [candidate division Zixibacteria bacterium]